MAQHKYTVDGIIGEIDIKKLSTEGTEFESKNLPNEDKPPDSNSHNNYFEEVEKHIKFDCLPVEDTKEDPDLSTEPFDNIAKKMTNLIPDGKIKKLVIREGYGERPQSGAQVKINYNGYVQFEALPFDSTYARKKPFEFQLGEGQCIPGLETAVESMRINEKSWFLVEPELTFKDSGLGRIPANSTILFEIELLDKIDADLKPAEENIRQFSVAFKKSTEIYISANVKFKAQDFSGAAREYQAAIKLLEDSLLNDHDDQLKCDELLAKLYSNSLICYTRLDQPKRGCYCANKIYQMAKNKTVQVLPKVYFNNAKCLMMLQDYNLAEKRLLIARNMESQNIHIQRLLNEIRRERQEYFKKGQIFRKGFLNS